MLFSLLYSMATNFREISKGRWSYLTGLHVLCFNFISFLAVICLKIGLPIYHWHASITETHKYMSHDMTKPTKRLCAQRKLRSAWSSQSSLSAWRKEGSLATHWAHSEDSDQTGRMPRLIWVLAGHTLILLVLSCCGSHIAFFWQQAIAYFSFLYAVWCLWWQMRSCLP